MNLTESIEKYGDRGYHEHQMVVIYHENDKDLTPIHIYLPTPPDWVKIDGWGLPAEQQKWHAPVMPAKLKSLVNRSDSIDKIWDVLQNNQKNYKEEIIWIKKQWYFVLNGYWFFNNGTPTYMDGWHYMYCGFFMLDIGLPDYRDKDRRWFHFARWTYTTTTDNKGKDFGERTVYGFNYPKDKRNGATYRTLCIGYCICITNMNCNCGIQSFDNVNAQNHFRNKLVYAWRKMPFFFRPYQSGTTDPNEGLLFKQPAIKSSAGDRLHSEKLALESKFDYATTALQKFYDGGKNGFLERTEVGKTTLASVVTCWTDVHKDCLSLGANKSINGLAVYDSTVEEMTKGGGDEFYILCKMSHNEQRKEHNGQTESGLVNLFIPAYDGLEGFIDEYGNSVIHTPPKPIKGVDGKMIKTGAYEYIQYELDSKLKANTAKSLRSYRQFKQRFPCCWADCWTGETSDLGMPVEKIVKREAELRRLPPLRTGFFRWQNGIKDTRVELQDDPEGAVHLSISLTEKETNRRIMKEDVYWPMWPVRYTIGTDNTMFMTEQEVKKKEDRHDRRSDAAFCIFMDRDKEIDNDTIPIGQWKTYRFVGDYLYRPLKGDDFFEQVIMAAVYFNAFIFPDANIRTMEDYIRRRGYAGYLKYGYKEGTQNSYPGYRTGKDKQVLFEFIKDYYQDNAERCMHARIMKQVREIGGIEYLSIKDLFAAAGVTIIGAQSFYNEVMQDSLEEGEFCLQNFYNVRF